MPRSTPRTPVTVSSRRQLAALVSPIRQEIVDAVVAAGPSTMAEIADRLGRPANTLYYHTRALASVGLLVEVDRRRAGRRFCAVYDVPGRPLVMRPGGPDGPQVIERIVRAALRLAARDLRRSLRHATSAPPSKGGGAAPPLRIEGPDRNLWAGRVKGWVDASDLEEAGRLMERLTELMGGAPRPGAHAQSFTFVLAPVITRTPARSTSSRAPTPASRRPRRPRTTSRKGAST